MNGNRYNTLLDISIIEPHVLDGTYDWRHWCVHQASEENQGACCLIGFSNKCISEFAIPLWGVFINGDVGEDTSMLSRKVGT